MAIRSGVMKDFARARPGEGKLSQATARCLLAAMDATTKLASDELAFAIQGLRDDVETFVGRPAQDVLGRSWSHGRPKRKR